MREPCVKVKSSMHERGDQQQHLLLPSNGKYPPDKLSLRLCKVTGKGQPPSAAEELAQEGHACEIARSHAVKRAS